MSENVFGEGYAGFYDLLYGDKDYQAECERIERLFERFAGRKVRSILDLGCGTGGHAFPLASRGYHVVGVDRSQQMLDHAQQKLAAERNAGTAERLEFRQADIQSLDLGRLFDAALMMFAVLGYQTTNAGISAAMMAARKHLEPGGLFVFDIWYGPAVLHERPTDRVKILETPEGQILRTASPVLDTRHQLCTVQYRLWQLKNGRLWREAQENHTMRFFFPMELEQFLSGSGFQLLHLSPLTDLDAEPGLESWNIIVCAKAR